VAEWYRIDYFQAMKLPYWMWLRAFAYNKAESDGMDDWEQVQEAKRAQQRRMGGR
jgi:hypothetical protein